MAGATLVSPIVSQKFKRLHVVSTSSIRRDLGSGRHSLAHSDLRMNALLCGLTARPWDRRPARANAPIGLARVGLSFLLLSTCGAIGGDNCAITAAVIPSSATADHSSPPPGNQVQFTAFSNVTGNCPLIADHVGSWSTSDPADTAISNEPATKGLATCLNAAPPATVAYSGTVRGRVFASATLLCK